MWDARFSCSIISNRNVQIDKNSKKYNLKKTDFWMICVLSSKPIATKRSKSVGFSYGMFVTFSIWAFLFESIEQEHQVPHIQKKDM